MAVSCFTARLVLYLFLEGGEKQPVKQDIAKYLQGLTKLPLNPNPITEVNNTLDLGEVTTSSITVTASEIPEATVYLLELTSPSGMNITVEILSEDLLDGVLGYTFTDLANATAYSIDLKYVDADGNVVDVATLETTTTSE